ncbi:LOW QUALITY PROTEIN: RNA polymerase I-specific transcription initiation factor RRN3 [Drosophila sulfurigaster albostrigata]|uniref:LOW QUALITY PROTEIN: RNA polymerase I-specific transcription initiation factor RRN3 n=1 Tax=Drosophila sulfurigaster albostrigata TaxID=89887 RepID=UPI002D21C10D|nr:LOW QUALITY PROTEIN: RNA polymerase I-specific transcription initiation factor RRN3 [Drosophila sulfurigaster albostrigata]
MSMFSSKTGITSILKSYSGADRERAKTAALNKVRFSTPKEKGIIESVRVALEEHNFHLIQEFTYFLREAELCDEEIVAIMRDARKIVHSLTPEFADLVEALLGINWKKRNTNATEAYSEFTVDVMIAHNTYIQIGINKLILNWIPNDQETDDWINGSPSESVQADLQTVHTLLNRILTAVPMAFDVVVDTIAAKFPYFKKPAHVTAGYIHNVLWLISSKPVYEELLLQLVLQKLLILDVSAPRDEIEALREDSDDEEDEMEADAMFQMDDVNTQPKQPRPLDHPIGQMLDICLLKLFKFLDDKCRPTLNANDEQRIVKNRFFKMLIHIFDEVLLPSHNIHHVQFVMFYVCSIRPAYTEAFLSFLWLKVQNPNVSSIIRHVAVSYIASFLARAKFVPLSTITYYLKELSNWANTYINDSDEFSAKNCSLKANMVFFSVCQAMFYLIAFRARDLTINEKNLMLLNTLQLSRLAMCHFNPLRYCLPPVATAFAGVTRTYQLAYCHTVLERNARRKLATIYGHDKLMPEETLDTFFPFDPYILPLSSKYIEPNYLVYKVHELEEPTEIVTTEIMRRKRGDSEMVEDDDFILADKRQKLSELSNSQLFDKQFYYGTSPGFNQQ